MRIAVLGGGFAGLSACFYLSKKGHEITLFEKEPVLGGLASGFRRKGWEWDLERAYHHWFANDHDVLEFAKEVGFEEIIYRYPETASLYEETRNKIQETNENNYRIISLDSPQDLLTFPYLSLPKKLRAGAVLAFLKLSPFLSLYEKKTAKDFLTQTMGEEAWKVLWEGLFRKKFGKYAEKVLASFIWARIKKRTKKLGYPKGGFQAFIDHIEACLKNANVKMFKGHAVDQIQKKGEAFELVSRHNKTQFDCVISTLPTPLVTKTAASILPQALLKRFSRIKYLHALNLIVETDEPILEKTYWLNVLDANLPIMVLVQHTNFIDKKQYGEKHILYIGNYLEENDKHFRMTNEELLHYYIPYIKKVQSSKFKVQSSFVFRGPFAQPIFDRDFLKNKPDFETPVKNFYIANLDMTYPYDRGTNYAVALGKKVSEFF
ncbi:FAD-dependent oxidoreductase [Candidatus Roizmanbacteria bacterium]|nr:FAD-dependent oxidoreductase [Candidatus Roizmanbacteria bacterium]